VLSSHFVHRIVLVTLVAMCAPLMSACGSSGGGDSGSTNTTTTPASTVPGAPSVSSVTAGDAQAIVTFSAPASNGGSAITSYTVSCAAGNTTRIVTNAVSPQTVTGLVNGTSFACTVTATNAVGTSAASASISVTPVAATTPTVPSTVSTLGVLCTVSTNEFNSSASVRLTSTSSWTCGTTSRVLSGNGVPDHETGTFPNTNNPTAIGAVNTNATYTLTPTQVSSTGTAATVVGHALNSIKFDPNTNGWCNDSGATCNLNGQVGNWQIEAIGQSSFRFGTDSSNAHVQPSGAYHYHGMPEAFITKLNKGQAMTLVGWAADGFPIYARYGYNTATSASSGVKIVRGSFQVKSTPDANRPATTLYPMGTFRQDYQYVAGSGDLDECNGRSGVTPEFPNGIYHYYVTDTYPYVQRCVKGSPAQGATGGP
jgi:hypothetical protein